MKCLIKKSPFLVRERGRRDSPTARTSAVGAGTGGILCRDFPRTPALGATAGSKQERERTGRKNKEARHNGND